MTYSTLASQTNLNNRFLPARSIPNLRNETCSTVQTCESYNLARCSSQPAEMWSRDLIVDSNIGENVLNKNIDASKCVSIATQTENNKMDLPSMEKFIAANRLFILNLLGIESSYHVECDLQPKTLIPILETDIFSSPEALSPLDNQKRFNLGVSSQKVIVSK